MKLNRLVVLIFVIISVLNVTQIGECAFPFGVGVFPLLTSGWYYKPSPVESVIFGLIVVKILAIRLASITGVLPIPYHLNDLFVRSLGKRSIPQYFSKSTNITMPHALHRHHWNNSSLGRLPQIGKISSDSNELKAMYRLLLGVRRLDTSDCFLKTLCFLGYDTAESETITSGDHELIETINYLTSVEEIMRKSRDMFTFPSVMDVFQGALTYGMESKFNSTYSSCDQKYSTCPLTEVDMRFESIISDLS